LDFFRIERADLAEMMRQVAPDVVHAHWLYEFAAAALCYQKDALITAHDSPYAIVRHYKHPYWWLRATLGLTTLARTTNLSVVSPSLINEIPNPFLRGTMPPVIIPNGIQIPSEVAERTLAGKQTVTFASIANGFDRRKNTAALIEAFGKVRAYMPNARLLLFGAEHGPREAASEWAAERGLGEMISFEGHVSHEALSHHLAHDIDVLVHTSVWEACSMAILEAQSHGVPVIGGTRSGGVAYTLGYGDAGTLVNIDNIGEIASAMLRSVSEPKAYRRSSMRAIENVREQFCFSGVVQKYLNRLEEIHSSRWHSS